MDVEEKRDDWDKPMFVISHPKVSAKFIISKIMGDYQFYKITKDAGEPPKELSGKYSHPDVALKALSNYLRTARFTQAAKNKETRERVEARKNGSKPNSNSKDDIQ